MIVSSPWAEGQEDKPRHVKHGPTGWLLIPLETLNPSEVDLWPQSRKKTLKMQGRGTTHLNNPLRRLASDSIVQAGGRET